MAVQEDKKGILLQGLLNQLAVEKNNLDIGPVYTSACFLPKIQNPLLCDTCQILRFQPINQPFSQSLSQECSLCVLDYTD